MSGSTRQRVAQVVDRQGRTRVRWVVGHGIGRAVLRAAARRGDPQGRLVSEAGAGPTEGLRPIFTEVRERAPLVRAGFSHLTARHAVVKEVLTSPDLSSGFPEPRSGILGRMHAWSREDLINPVAPPSMLVTEPPDHTRYRRLVTRVFSAKAIEQLRGRVQEIADGLLDDLEGAAREGREVDLVADYCALLPVTVITEILGVPAEDRDLVLRYGEQAAPSLDFGLSWRDFQDTEEALRGFDAWLRGHLETLRDHPGDDLLSRLVAARDDEGDGSGLSDLELRSTAGLVLAAGFETTVNLLSNGIALLAAHPDQRQVLVDRPELWATAVDEVLRLDPPVMLTGRTAVRDTEIAGCPVSEGAVVSVLLAGANLDPEVFEDPERFDVARVNAKDHLSFSSGRHFCLGASLARMEGEIGLRSLLARYPDLELLPGARRRSTRVLRGYATLPARLSSTDRSGAPAPVCAGTRPILTRRGRRSPRRAR